MPGAPFTPFHAEPLAETASGLQILDKLHYGGQKGRLLRGCQSIEVHPEAKQPAEGGQKLLASASPARGLRKRTQGLDELFAGVECLAPPCHQVGVRLALAGLPRSRPEPSLRGVDYLLGPEQDPLRGQFDLHGVPLF